MLQSPVQDALSKSTLLILAGMSGDGVSPFYTAGNPRFNAAAVYEGAPSSAAGNGPPRQRSSSYSDGGGSYPAAAPQPPPSSSSFFSGPMGSVPAPTPFPTGAAFFRACRVPRPKNKSAAHHCSKHS
jgi:hypothetical protein